MGPLVQHKAPHAPPREASSSGGRSRVLHSTSERGARGSHITKCAPNPGRFNGPFSLKSFCTLFRTQPTVARLEAGRSARASTSAKAMSRSLQAGPRGREARAPVPTQRGPRHGRGEGHAPAQDPHRRRATSCPIAHRAAPRSPVGEAPRDWPASRGVPFSPHDRNDEADSSSTPTDQTSCRTCARSRLRAWRHSVGSQRGYNTRVVSDQVFSWLHQQARLILSVQLNGSNQGRQ